MPVDNAIARRILLDREFTNWAIITVSSVVSVKDWLPWIFHKMILHDKGESLSIKFRWFLNFTGIANLYQE